MKHCLFVFIGLLFCTTLCRSQTGAKAPQNAFSFELGKTWLVYNLDVDHKLAERNIGLHFQLGSNFGRYLRLTTVGGGIYILIGKSERFFELGLDLQYLAVNEVSDDQKGFSSLLIYPDFGTKTLYPSLNLGYRSYGKKNLFRVGVSPGLIDGKLIPGGYISYGFRF